jgi:hypothetical protein
MTNHAIAIIADRVTPWVASLTTSTAAAVTGADVTPLPNWVDASILGGVVLVLGYTTRHLFGKWDESRQRHMEFLEKELERTREELRRANDRED